MIGKSNMKKLLGETAIFGTLEACNPLPFRLYLQLMMHCNFELYFRITGNMFMIGRMIFNLQDAL